MTATRLNKGKPTGLLLTEIGNWGLYKTAEDRCKLAAITPIHGKANYAFGIRAGRISSHHGLDSTLLRHEHPELFQAVDAYFQSLEPAKPEASEEADPYGDLALNRRRMLTPEQNWKRGLLQMRRIEFERVAVKAETMWEAGVRMLYAGVFKTKIDDLQLQNALAWITQRKGEVDINGLLNLEQDYYSGKLGAKPMSELETRLDQLAGSNDYENLEADNGSVEKEGRGGGGDAATLSGQQLGIGGSTASGGEAIRDVRESGQGVLDRTAPSEERHAEPDPFAAFN